MKVRVLDEATVRDLLPVQDAVAVVGVAMAALSRGQATLPDPSDLDLPHGGEMHVKGAYLHGSQYFSYKAATGFYTNVDLGLPVTSGLSLVFDAKTGVLRCLVLDGGFLTELRTGAAGAIAARELAREDALRVGILGAGGQARYQLQALAGTRTIGNVMVYSRRSEAASAYADEMQSAYGVQVSVCDSIERLVAESEILVTTTPVRAPLIKSSWVTPGTHITAMGSDLPAKNELDPALLGRADKVVVDRLSQAATKGELHHALDAGVMSLEQVHGELGEIVGGTLAGRQSYEEITIADLTGLGVQDAAVVDAVVERAETLEVGAMLELGKV